MLLAVRVVFSAVVLLELGAPFRAAAQTLPDLGDIRAQAERLLGSTLEQVVGDRSLAVPAGPVFPGAAVLGDSVFSIPVGGGALARPVHAEVRHDLLIILAPRWRVVQTFVGDPARWRVTSTDSLVIVQPGERGAQTNLSIMLTTGDVIQVDLIEVTPYSGIPRTGRLYIGPEEWLLDRVFALLPVAARDVILSSGVSVPDLLADPAAVVYTHLYGRAQGIGAPAPPPPVVAVAPAPPPPPVRPMRRPAPPPVLDPVVLEPLLPPAEVAGPPVPEDIVFGTARPPIPDVGSAADGPPLVPAPLAPPVRRPVPARGRSPAGTLPRPGAPGARPASPPPGATVSPRSPLEPTGPPVPGAPGDGVAAPPSLAPSSGAAPRRPVPGPAVPRPSGPVPLPPGVPEIEGLPATPGPSVRPGGTGVTPLGPDSPLFDDPIFDLPPGGGPSSVPAPPGLQGGVDRLLVDPGAAVVPGLALPVGSSADDFFVRVGFLSDSDGVAQRGGFPPAGMGSADGPVLVTSAMLQALRNRRDGLRQQIADTRRSAGDQVAVAALGIDRELEFLQLNYPERIQLSLSWSPYMAPLAPPFWQYGLWHDTDNTYLRLLAPDPVFRDEALGIEVLADKLDTFLYRLRGVVDEGSVTVLDRGSAVRAYWFRRLEAERP